MRARRAPPFRITHFIPIEEDMDEQQQDNQQQEDEVVLIPYQFITASFKPGDEAGLAEAQETLAENVDALREEYMVNQPMVYYSEIDGEVVIHVCVTCVAMDLRTEDAAKSGQLQAVAQLNGQMFAQAAQSGAMQPGSPMSDQGRVIAFPGAAMPKGVQLPKR